MLAAQKREYYGVYIFDSDIHMELCLRHKSTNNMHFFLMTLKIFVLITMRNWF